MNLFCRLIALCFENMTKKANGGCCDRSCGLVLRCFRLYCGIHYSETRETAKPSTNQKTIEPQPRMCVCNCRAVGWWSPVTQEPKTGCRSTEAAKARLPTADSNLRSATIRVGERERSWEFSQRNMHGNLFMKIMSMDPGSITNACFVRRASIELVIPWGRDVEYAKHCHNDCCNPSPAPHLARPFLVNCG